MVDKYGRGFFFSEDFKATVSGHYYVDKSLFLKDFIDSHPQVSLITRPRRFGKSLNMNMTRTFFEKTEEDNSIYFKDLKIWKCGDKYTSQLGKYPVVYLDFNSTDRANWDETFSRIKNIIADEYKAHNELEGHVSEDDLDKYNRIRNGIGDEGDYGDSLALLLKLLRKCHGVKPIVLIDEYDSPIESGCNLGYYDDVILFMKHFLSEGLKNDENLSFAILTGITRVSNESLFSGLNNVVSYSVVDKKYGEYFGFTKDEVKAVLEDFGHLEKYDEIADWYDGYLFGETEIFNPWSVASYIEKEFKPAKYWAGTSSRGQLKTVLDNVSEDEEAELELLGSGKKIKALIDEDIPYDRLRNGKNVYSILLASGYLKNCEATEDERKELASHEHYLTVPNKEVGIVFCREILDYMNDKYGKAGDYSANILNALEKSDVRRLQSLLNGFMEDSVSVRDKKEDFYHGLFLGLVGNLGENYKMESNREHGDGMPDLIIESFGYGLRPYNREKQSIILEFKYCGDIDALKSDGMTNEEYIAKKDKLMAASAQTALNQIERKNYARDFEKLSSRILKYGIAFHGKESKVYLVESANGKNVKKNVNKISTEGELPM